MNKDQLIDFDLPIIITTVKRYTKFSITKINIPFGSFPGTVSYDYRLP